MSYSLKKGIAMSSPSAEDWDRLNLAPTAPAYVWHANLPKNMPGEWAPMYWGHERKKVDSWYKYLDTSKPYKKILVINEGDWQRPDGSDTPPWAAAAIHHEVHCQFPEAEIVAPNLSMVDLQNNWAW